MTRSGDTGVRYISAYVRFTRVIYDRADGEDMKTPHSLTLHFGIVCIAALCAALAIAGPGCDLAAEDRDASSTSPPDTSTSSPPDTPIADTNTPDGESEPDTTQVDDSLSDSVVIDGDGAYELLDGEIILTVNGGALSGERVDVLKDPTAKSLGTLISYIWGPHGKPIEPPAALQITVPLDQLDAEKPEELRVVTLSNRKPLDQEAPIIEDGRITFRATFREIDVIAIQIMED